MKKLSAQLCMVAALLFVAVVYFLQLPSTVQFGDTGELVAAAKNLFVPHPPGYPVFIWLQALFVNLVPWGSVFWRASFLSAVFSIAGLAFFAKASKEVNLVTVGAILLVAFSRIFWRYSELPDVFSLNTLFAAVILYLYFQNDGKKRMRLLPFVFCVGLANHHTLIFLAPLVLCVMWTHRHEKVFYFSAGLGAIAFVGLYASLQLLNPESFYSWGKVTSASEVVRHFFRADYGTFRLMGSDQSFSIFRNYKDVFTKTLLFLYPLFVLAVVACSGILGARPRLQRKDFFVLGSALLYGGVFFSLANTASTGFLLEVLDRFLILFQFLIAFVLLRVIQSSQASNLIKKIMGVFLIAAACLHLFWWHKENDFSKNTIVEDYAINLLNEAPADKQTVALISSDTRAFATRYVQSVLNVRPDVKVILITSFFRNEGKSFTSLNLVSILAQTGKRAVIMEFDLRKPKLLKRLNMTNDRGISDYIVTDIPESSIIKTVKSRNSSFDVIGCGNIPPNPGELILNEKVDKLIKYLRQNYDYVIIDTAPVGLVADTFSLSRIADATLYIVRHDQTEKTTLNFVNKVKAEHKLPNMGIVINGIKNKHGFGYSYGYGYGYGYGYASEPA